MKGTKSCGKGEKMKMKLKKYLMSVFTGLVSLCCLCGCAGKEKEKPVSDNAPEAGIYSIEAESDSAMFKIEQAKLTIAGDGSMEAVITLSGTGYTMLYMGTAKEAAAAAEEERISFVEDAEGAYTYTIPVTALDQPLSCAAFSKKKEEWYDRQITFHAASLQKGVPEGNGTENKGTEEPKGDNKDDGKDSIGDGVYTIELTFEGGSGKAAILSTASLVVAGDTKTATVRWNSPNYDYMLVDGEKYFPVNTEGDSVFEIPVRALDEALSVIGDTVAMSKPREIEYTITFHSDTMKPAE